MDIPFWISLWAAGIAIIKLINIFLGYIRQKEIIAVHSVMNKVTGGLLFIFPLKLPFIDLTFSAMAICVIATAAAIQEGYFVSLTSSSM